MGLHLCSLRNLSSFYDSLNSSPGILTESDFSLSYSSPCQPKESDLSLACHFQNRSPDNHNQVLILVLFIWVSIYITRNDNDNDHIIITNQVTSKNYII